MLASPRKNCYKAEDSAEKNGMHSAVKKRIRDHTCRSGFNFDGIVSRMKRDEDPYK